MSRVISRVVTLAMTRASTFILNFAPTIALTFAFPLAIAPAIASANIDRGDAAYGKELLSRVEERLAQVRSAKAAASREKALTELRSWLESEKSRARAELEKAEASGVKRDEERADARDTEVLRLYYSFEPVFRELFSPRFKTQSVARENACRSLPKEIRLNELAAKPEGTPLSIYGERAIAVVNEFCDREG